MCVTQNYLNWSFEILSTSKDNIQSPMSILILKCLPMTFLLITISIELNNLDYKIINKLLNERCIVIINYCIIST